MEQSSGEIQQMHIKYLNYKKVARVMSGVGPRSSCSSLFRKLNILHIACQYILSLMLFILILKNLSNAHVHG